MNVRIYFGRLYFCGLPKFFLKILHLPIDKTEIKSYNAYKSGRNYGYFERRYIYDGVNGFSMLKIIFEYIMVKD